MRCLEELVVQIPVQLSQSSERIDEGHDSAHRNGLNDAKVSQAWQMIATIPVQ